MNGRRARRCVRAGGAVALAWAVYQPQSLSAVVALAAPSLPWDTGLSTYYRLTSSPILGPIVTGAVMSATSAEGSTGVRKSKIFGGKASGFQ